MSEVFPIQTRDVRLLTSAPLHYAELLQSFLQNFTEDDGKAKYMEVLVSHKQLLPLFQTYRGLKPSLGAARYSKPSAGGAGHRPGRSSAGESNFGKRRKGNALRAFRSWTLSQLTGVGLHNQEGQTDLVEKISTNALRYVRLIGEAADRLMPAATRTDLPEDIFDVLQRQVRTCASHACHMPVGID